MIRMLERRIRELTLAEVTNTIRAHRVELVDGKGNVRMVLSAVDGDTEWASAIEVRNNLDDLVAGLYVPESGEGDAKWTFFANAPGVLDHLEATVTPIP
ncbi:MAG TPA: hypothetical protein VE991_04265 [Acidimicrobiales bacterium]|nr:hypothetical protein [Acidimicrobiales bacterium]